MSSPNLSVTQTLRNRTTIAILVVSLVVVLIWLVGFFNPQGHKLSDVQSQIGQAQIEQGQLQAQLARLKA